MNFQTYQFQANETSGGKGDFSTMRLATAALGLAGESGEVCDHIKKAIGHGHKLDTEQLRAELGDCLWYIAELCTTLELSLQDVAQYNLDKLARRYAGGFSSEKSINRVE